MTSLFISYSRRDIDFARKLTESFKGQELEFWIDWEGIPPTVDWWKEIEKGIEEADIFLFLISPDSAKSRVCQREIEHAARNGKRLIPLVVRDIKGEEAPVELAHLNWIFIREVDDFQSAFEKLITAIQTDFAWVKAHRQLQVKALEWERNNHENSFLLRGKELVEAESQLATNTSREPHPTDLQRAYVLKSRQATDRQRRITTTIAIAGLIALAALSVVAFVQAGLATTNAQEAQNQAATAQAASTLASDNAATAQANAEEAQRQAGIALSRQLAAQSGAWLDDEYDLALLLSVQSYNISNTTEAQSSLLDSLQFNPLLESILRGHGWTVVEMAFSPNSQYLASADEGGQIIIWDVSNPNAPHQTGQPFRYHTASIKDLLFSPDGDWLAFNDADGTIILLDVSNPDRPGMPGLPLTGFESGALGFSENGQRLLSCDLNGIITAWDVSNPARPIPVSQIRLEHQDDLVSLAFSTDGRWLASGNNAGLINLWDISSPEEPIQYVVSLNGTTVVAGTTMGVQQLRLSSDGTMLATVDTADKIILWDVSNPVAPVQLSPPFSEAYAISSVVFHPDGNILASSSCDRFDTTNLACVDGQVVLWDISDPTAPVQAGKSLTVTSDQILDVVFSPDGKTLASAGVDRTIALWNFSNPEDTVPLGRLIHGSTKRPYIAALSSDGRLLASDSDENGVILFDVSNMDDPIQLSTVFPDNNEFFIRSMAIGPDRRVLAAGREDGKILLWDISTPAAPIQLPAISQEGSVRSLDWSPNNQLLASGGGAVVLWDMSNPAQPVSMGTLTDHSDEVISVVFSPDGSMLASASWDDTIMLWNVANPAAPVLLDRIISNHSDEISGLAFSPDGNILASGSWDKTVILWNISNPSEPAQLGVPLSGHSSLVWSVAFSPDGRWLASGSSDQTVILWDVSNPRKPSQLGVLPLVGVSKWVLTTEFSSNGHVLASVGSTLTIWDVNPLSWRNRACQIAGRNLTREEWEKYIGDGLQFQAVCPQLPMESDVILTPVP